MGQTEPAFRMEINTARLRLQLAEPSNFNSLHNFIREPRMAEAFSFPRQMDQEAFALAMEAGHFLGLFGIVDQESDEWVGTAGLYRTIHFPGWLGLLYGLKPGVRGKGYATEAGAALLEFAFRSTDAVGVLAEVHEGNPASRRVAEGLGMHSWHRRSGGRVELLGLSRTAHSNQSLHFEGQSKAG